MTTPNMPVPDKDEDVLEFTKHHRVRLLEAICPEGKPPVDIKDRSLLLQTLSDMDKAALGRIRIRADEGIGSNQAAAAASILTKLLTDARVRDMSRTPNATASAPELHSNIEAGKVIDGELDIGRAQETFEEFTARTQDIQLRNK